MLPPMKIAIKRPSSIALTKGRLAIISATKELATELATNYLPNPPNYDPSLFSGLTYKEIGVKLAAL